ncbi:MAG: 3-keto-5-aminohexanoate cleavage protein [Oscillospiraceae bacterium]|jgi:uncharacterized protein (DUF849 family)|nr:3-keto-5-aminohexanoate cleavage protein [Oscillospiraceae bacterium]
MNNDLVISVALTGAWPTKADNPAVPFTKEEIAADVIACAKAGASVVHIHARDAQGIGTMDTEVFCGIVEHVRTEMEKHGVDINLNLTTSGALGMTDEIRIAHLERLRPEMCSYDCGSMNWMHKSVFENSPAFLEKLGRRTQELGVKPELEIFDGGMVENAKYYIKTGVLRPPCNFQLVLGAPGGLAGGIENLMFLRSLLPDNCTWSATGIGRFHMPVLLAALALGADGIRVGLEDNVLMAKGVPATNESLVLRAAELARLAGRTVATAARARELLDLRKP